MVRIQGIFNHEIAKNVYLTILSIVMGCFMAKRRKYIIYYHFCISKKGIGGFTRLVNKESGNTFRMTKKSFFSCATFDWIYEKYPIINPNDTLIITEIKTHGKYRVLKNYWVGKAQEFVDLRAKKWEERKKKMKKKKEKKEKLTIVK